MEIKHIMRKNRLAPVREIRVGDLNKSQCSRKFLLLNLSPDTLVNVRCFEDGELDFRGKRKEYRILPPDDKQLDSSVIVLTREDLVKFKSELPIGEITIYDFKSSAMTRDEMYEAESIIFKDGGEVKELKSRGLME